jgi:hypothetical protein
MENLLSDLRGRLTEQDPMQWYSAAITERLEAITVDPCLKLRLA